MSYRIFLIIEYDGTDFCGFQFQNNGRSVQGELQNALEVIYKQPITVVGCSRTDAGVHARGHVCHADVPFKIEASKIPLALNPFLPNDLGVKKAYYVDDNFSSRFDNQGKRYCYRIFCSKTKSPLISRYTYQVPYKLDVDKMAKAATYFEGEHDFVSFCASAGTQKTTVRRMKSVTVKRDPNNEHIVDIEVIGEAFLYNMVRIMAGTLLDVGLGRKTPEDILKILEAKDRKLAGRTLPPEGLTLEEVYYKLKIE